MKRVFDSNSSKTKQNIHSAARRSKRGERCSAYCCCCWHVHGISAAEYGFSLVHLIYCLDFRIILRKEGSKQREREKKSGRKVEKITFGKKKSCFLIPNENTLLYSALSFLSIENRCFLALHPLFRFHPYPDISPFSSPHPHKARKGRKGKNKTGKN